MIKDLMVAYPKESVIILAVLVTLVMTLVTKYFTNQNRMKELKQIQKACNIKLKTNRTDADAQKQLMACSMELMKHSFKPLFITFIPLLIFFWWIRGIYTGVFASWLWWYIGSGIVSSIAIRKVLKVA